MGVHACSKPARHDTARLAFMEELESLKIALLNSSMCLSFSPDKENKKKIKDTNIYPTSIQHLSMIYHDLSWFIKLQIHKSPWPWGPSSPPLCVALAARSRRASPVSAALLRTSGVTSCHGQVTFGSMFFYEKHWGYHENRVDANKINCVSYIYIHIYIYVYICFDGMICWPIM